MDERVGGSSHTSARTRTHARTHTHTHTHTHTQANDISHKKRKNDTMKDRFMPAPDSLLAQAQQEIAGGSHTELDARQQTLGGIATVAGTQSGMASQMTDLNKVGEGRNTYLQLKLDRVSDSVPAPYLNPKP